MQDAGHTSAALAWAAGEVADRLAQVLAAMTEQEHSSRWTPANEPPGSLLWWEYPVAGALEGSVRIGCNEADCLSIGGMVLAAAGVDSDPETARTTFAEVIAQALSAVAQSVSTRVHAEVTFGVAQESAAAPEWPSMPLIEIAVKDGADEGRVVFAAFSAEVLAGLAPREAPDSHPEGSKTGVPPAPVQPPIEGGSATFDLLLDVELPVSVSFGRTQLQIRHVMKLASGSIVELNRNVSEPVEVIVNNCVIARGEVVVIEGNYGVRIDEIISPHERLRTLK